MPEKPSYRTLAEKSLGSAGAEFRGLQGDRPRFEEVMANSARTQAIAAISIAQALLYIGDAITAQAGPQQTRATAPAPAATDDLPLAEQAFAAVQARHREANGA